jgi:Endonuclease/Exonuclease/phosphatase family
MLSVRKSFRLAALLAVFVLHMRVGSPGFAADPDGSESSVIRVATYNTSLNRDTDGHLVRDLENGNNEQARKIAEVIQRVRPDILFLNEFDYDTAGSAAELFRKKYLAVGQNGCEPIEFAHHFTGPVNTGVPSGRDLSHNGKAGGADDAFGYGRHPGQYGMLVLSKFPIDRDHARTFQKVLWRNMPNALLPVVLKTQKPFYNDDDLAIFRLPSKSVWDVPINVPGRGGSRPFMLHLLCSHPTPPVFDGPEDRNGHRNHDEVRLIADYIDPKKSSYLKDDSGNQGGLRANEEFAIVGDLNCDPVDGEGMRSTMDQLLKNPHVNASFIPTSEGGPLTEQKFPDQFTNNHGDPARVTANFTEEGHGCLRIDYVLPSRGIEVVRGGIFWPTPGEPGADAVTATDHRCVWIDVRPADKK